jgi:hypothetical protein
MKTSDRYHKWVEWSEDNQVYLGKCPDLITGIHGSGKVSEGFWSVVAFVFE